jgi:glycosyltransferase involved in cell wall biosynthesis
VIHTFHGHVFHSYYGARKTQIFLFIERMLARFASEKIVVISRQQFGEIHERFGVGRPEQFEIIPLGIDLKPFADWQTKRGILREEIGAGAGELLVGLVGRLTEVKNHSMFLRVAKIYMEKPDVQKLKFIIVGDGHLRETLEREADALGVKDSVIFIGSRSDADVFYAGLDIVALTSLNEGTPLSLIEAMANEKPVISTAVGGVVDLLGTIKVQKEGFQICERGICAVSDDAGGFCKGLLYLANNAKIRETLGTSGKNFVGLQYGKARLMNDVKSLYRRLIEN